MKKTAVFWIRDGVLVDRMPVNAVAFAVASLVYAHPDARTQTSLSGLINFAFQTSGISCTDKMCKFNAERLELIRDVNSAALYYNTLATEAASRCNYFRGACENLAYLHEYGALNFITSAVDQQVLDAWAASDQGKLIAPYLEEILGKRSAEFDKGRAHFAYVRDEYGVSDMAFVADAVNEIAMAAPLRPEFNLQTIGFANAISKNKIWRAHKLVLAAHVKLNMPGLSCPAASLALNEAMLSLPDEKSLQQALSQAQADRVISGHALLDWQLHEDRA